MRLKTMPRRRKTNYLDGSTNGGQEHTSSMDIRQDVKAEFIDIGEYGRMSGSLKKLETEDYEVPGTSEDSDPMQFDDRKYIGGVGLVEDVESSVKKTSEVVNLSIKNGFEIVVKNEPSSEFLTPENTSSSDKFAGSLLYQIMTDPTFVENIKSNKEMKKLTCKFCKKTFGNCDELQDHLESRLNEFDRMTCCACGKTFGQKRYLRYHQRCHIENNKFTCEICTKKYSRMDNLTRHRAYHTNPDRYQCKMCSKTFSRRDLMMKHLKSHQGKKICCLICNESFLDFAQMKAHRLSVHAANKAN